MKIISPMPYGNGAYVVHKMLEKGIAGYSVAGYNPYWSLFPPSLFFLGRKGRADIIHTTPDYGIFFSKKGTPLVLTLHNFMLDRFMQRYSSLPQKIHYATDLRFFTLQSLEQAAAVTSVSRFTAQAARKELKYTGDIRVIYNGIDSALFKPLVRKQAQGPIKVLFSGNLTKRKGAHLLPLIAEKLNKGIIIQYTRGLRTKAAHCTSSRLDDMGAIPYKDMPALYQQADILLFPTVREGLSLSAMEAMASGLPIVTTDCSSMSELVTEGRGGMLCGIESIDGFAEKINLLADSPGLRRAMGEFNRERIEKEFTLDRMLKSYQELFIQLLDRNL
jgi:glycosyltransferase involved in cell wall biosynthesis